MLSKTIGSSLSLTISKNGKNKARRRLKAKHKHKGKHKHKSHKRKNKHKRLRIIQVISNYPQANRVPPTNQGGTEKIVYELTEELVHRGQDVYLYAAKGSRSSARLITYPKGLKSKSIGSFVLNTLPKKVDIIHDHTFKSVLGRSKTKIPTLCTLHMPEKHWVKHPVYVSKRARSVMGKGRGFYVHNGINPRDYQYSENKQGFLLFIGRILKSKGILHALDIADITKKKLIIAGPIKDNKLFKNKILPRIKRNPRIRYVGAVGGKKKQQLLKHASCLLFPTVWEEPFGLVMIEAMACGTPVVALNNGAVPEILARFPELICKNVKQMVRKVKRGRYPSSRKLRKYVMEKYTTKKMTDRYLKLYNKIRRRG
ncbi:glycosyltransferase family 4 protein [Paenibacillus psychroresistens]|uniref:Glycosyltransferase family 4 protein n=2 Tax=Paenibacillus psychroresistens TaxID=1778678 RepID=A0A6B8RWI6_9BACL|nr:glycosyltransferase family 4 protein [Paenibacillus psychroresistens]